MLRMTAIAMAAILLSTQANAETLTLVCGIETLISAKTGLPSWDYDDIFRIEVDLKSQKLTTPSVTKNLLSHKTEISADRIIWEQEGDVLATKVWWNYTLNRHTGTLVLLKMVMGKGKGEDLVGKGKCVKPDPLF